MFIQLYGNPCLDYTDRLTLNRMAAAHPMHTHITNNCLAMLSNNIHGNQNHVFSLH